jgi:hypothetical protein
MQTLGPESAPVLADLIVKNADWPDAQEATKRLRNLVPPAALRDPNQPPPDPMQDPMARAELEEGLGPMRSRPQREQLRTQLQGQLRVPEHVRLSVDDDVVLVDEGGKTPRRFEPGQPYSRVDSIGTAKITIRLQGSVFEVTENYGKGRSNRESYAMAPKGGQMVVTRTLARPGMKDVKITSVYTPASAG